MFCSARRLFSETTSCSEAATIFGTSPASGEIIINGTRVCRSGENEVFYDVGTLDANGNFVATVLSAFSQIVTVSVGLPSAFQLVFLLAKSEQTLTETRSQIFIDALDSGGNVRLCVFIKCMLKRSMSCFDIALYILLCVLLCIFA